MGKTDVMARTVDTYLMTLKSISLMLDEINKLILQRHKNP